MEHWLMQQFQQQQALPAIVDRNGSHSYQTLVKKIQYYSSRLEEQIPAGSNVVILSDYSLDSIALFIACATMSVIVIPIISNNEQEIEEKLVASGAQFILTLENASLIIKQANLYMEESNPLCESIRQKKHSGLILFSSGSTGKPKAMLHDLSVLLDTYKNKKQKKLSIMIFLLFDHIGGINTLFNALSMGAKAVIPDNRNADSVAQLIEREKVSILPASPTFLNLLLLSDVLSQYDLSSIRMITYGTEPMPESLLNRIKQAFPKAKLLQTFGTSETGIAQINSRSSNSLDIKINDPNQKYKIVDGELWLKSKTQILGYLNAPMDSFTEDGWFCTGDLVEEHEDGYLKIIGRAKEIINVGGEKVLPAEVESQLLTIEGVEDCMVYGLNNAITGQAVAADIVKSEGVQTKELKNKIRKECFTKMERFKIPTKFYFKDQLAIGDRFKKIRLQH